MSQEKRSLSGSYFPYLLLTPVAKGRKENSK